MKGKLLLSIGLGGLLLALMLGLLALTRPPAARAAGEIFTVNNTGDDPDASPGNCQCRTSGGACTLRAAIQEANACSGPQTIRFSAPMQIYPATALPALADNGTVIDGSDRWLVVSGYEVPGVVLNGQRLNFSGLVITASNCAVYGLGIRDFGQHGVYLYGGAQNNFIGGPGTHQRNVISHNGVHGVRIEGATTTSNTVSSNYIGTDFTGRTAYGNSGHGVSIWQGAGNVVFNNLIAANGWSGVAVDYVSDGAIPGNRIGVNISGAPLGNGFFGVHVSHGSEVEIVGNEIAFNQRGIHVELGSKPWIFENTIYSNTATLLMPPYGGGILVRDTGSWGEIGHNDILSNSAQFGGGIALFNGAGAYIYYNTIQANRAYSPAMATIAGYGGGIFVSLGGTGTGILYNRILSNTAWSDKYEARGGGIFLFAPTSVSVVGNDIIGNRAIDSAAGMHIRQGNNTVVRDNRFVRNRVSQWGDGSALAVDGGSSWLVLENNWIFDNSSGEWGWGNAVYIYYSSQVSLTNNVIASNDQTGLMLSDSNDIVVVHNTIALNSPNGIELQRSVLNLYNSIIVSNTGCGVSLDADSVLNQGRNDVWGNRRGGCDGPIDFYMERDPLFFNAMANQYGLRWGSPCLDVGDTSPGRTSPTSYNGVSRPQGAGPDLGAYEMPPPAFLPLVLRNF